MLSILGTPRDIEDYGYFKAFIYNHLGNSYQSDSVEFKNGKVTSYKNNSGKLPISNQQYSKSTVPQFSYTNGQRVKHISRDGTERDAIIVHINTNVGVGETHELTIKFIDDDDDAVCVAI